jgi:CRP/FNR family putative post-exponential-phase nitrogen-starvation transcriptional regulator
MESIFKQYGKIIHYKSNRYIIKQNYSITFLFLIVKGKAKAVRFREDGFEILLEIFNSGDVLGDIELVLNNQLYTTSIKTIDDLDVYVIPINVAKRLLKTDIKFSNLIGKQLANKLYNTSNQTSINNTLSVTQRFIQYLELSCEDDIFDESLVEIAQLLSVSYRHLIRVINTLCKEDILEPIEQSNKRKRIYKFNRKNILK